MKISKFEIRINKLLSAILVISILLSTGIFSIANPKKAEAALNPGAKVNYRIYHSQLRNYLLNYSAVSGRNCNISPRPSFCLSLKAVNDIMAWVRDPNNDGDKSDGILMVADSTSRKYAMQDAVRKGFHPWIMAKIVIPWEVITTHYTINPPDLSADNSVSFADSYWKNFVLKADEFFSEFRGIAGDYVTGDAVIRNLAYWRQPGIELAPGVPKLVLKPKSKVSAAARDKLYGIRRSDGTWKGGVLRMQPYRDFKGNYNWDPDEIVEMNNAISFQQSVEKFMNNDYLNFGDNSQNAKYKRAKMIIGLWDGVQVAMDVIPPAKALKMAAMAKSGAKEANGLSKIARITLGGKTVAADLTLADRVTAFSKTLKPVEGEQAIKAAEESLSAFHRLIAKWLPERLKAFRFWDNIDLYIVPKDSPLLKWGEDYGGRFLNPAEVRALNLGNGSKSAIIIAENVWKEGRTTLPLAFEEALLHEYTHYLRWEVNGTYLGLLEEAFTDNFSREALIEIYGMNRVMFEAGKTGYAQRIWVSDLAYASQQIRSEKSIKAAQLRIRRAFVNGDFAVNHPISIIDRESGIQSLGSHFYDGLQATEQLKFDLSNAKTIEEIERLEKAIEVTRGQTTTYYYKSLGLISCEDTAPLPIVKPRPCVWKFWIKPK